MGQSASGEPVDLALLNPFMADVIIREREEQAQRERAAAAAAAAALEEPLDADEHAARVAEALAEQQNAECGMRSQYREAPLSPAIKRTTRAGGGGGSLQSSSLHFRSSRVLSPLYDCQLTALPLPVRSFPLPTPFLSRSAVLEQDMQFGASLADIDAEMAAQASALAISNQASASCFAPQCCAV